MSSPNEPANNPKPVLKDKNPHNYRKVGYSMIVISVSLVAIGLLVWAIGDDYHFSTNIMAAQEVDAMTPKSGYNVVLFDVSQPVGAKLKLLDEAGTIDAARALQAQDAKQYAGKTIQVLVFNSTSSYNLKLMADAEVFIQTPPTGYNVVLFNDPLPVGQKLTLGIHEELLANATDYQKTQEDNLKGQDIQVLIFTPDFRSDLKMITGSNVPVGDYTSVAYNMTNQTTVSQTQANQTAQAPTNSTNATSSITQQTATTNQTTTVMANQSSTSGNQTISHTANMTMVGNKTSTPAMNMTVAAANNTSATSKETTSEKTEINATATTKVSKSVTLNETVGMNATGK